MKDVTLAAIIGVIIIIITNLFYLIDQEIITNITSFIEYLYKIVNIVNIIGHLLVLSFFVKLYQKQVNKLTEDEQGN